MGDAMDRLVRGTAKLEPEILDELGIMVRLDDAVTDYAIANNKAVDSITQFERRQAFLNATIEQGTKKFDEIAEVVDANPYDKLAASFSDLSHELIELVSKGLIPLIDLLSSSPWPFPSFSRIWRRRCTFYSSFNTSSIGWTKILSRTSYYGLKKGRKSSFIRIC